MVGLLDRKQAEEHLVRTQYSLQSAQQMGKVGTWELDLEQNRLVRNDETYRLFGVPTGTELDYGRFLDCVHPEGQTRVPAPPTCRVARSHFRECLARCASPATTRTVTARLRPGH
jgi:PAS domain-containing protein